MPKPGDPYPKANRGIRILTNAPTRESRPGFKPRERNAIEGKRGIRRLMKRDPAKGLELKSTDKMTDTHVGGGSGTEGVPRPRILSKNRTPATDKATLIAGTFFPALGDRNDKHKET